MYCWLFFDARGILISQLVSKNWKQDYKISSDTTGRQYLRIMLLFRQHHLEYALIEFPRFDKIDFPNDERHRSGIFIVFTHIFLW